MIAFVLYHPISFVWIFIIPILIFLFFRAVYKRKKAIKILFPHRSNLVFKGLNGLRSFKMVLVCTALLCIIVGLTRPAWNLKQTKSVRSGRDIIVLLDVSRSMLAQDVSPNRLEYAKEAILELSEEIQGDRISLVVFAGAAQIACPLTFDYDFFRNVCTSVDWQSANVGGSYLAEGLKRVTEDILNDKNIKKADILILSDGGDMGQMSKLGEALSNNNINLISIGIGNSHIESLIPNVSDPDIAYQGYVKYKGDEVRTSLKPEPLKRIVELTKGAYIEPGNETLDLWTIYQNHKQNADNNEFSSSETNSFKEQFQWFLGMAIILLLLALSIPRKIKQSPFFILLPLIFFSLNSCTYKDTEETELKSKDIKELFKEAVENYNKKEYSVARTAFTQVFENSDYIKAKAQSAYNMANCYFYETKYLDFDDEEEEIDIDAFTLDLYNESERYYRIALHLQSDMQDAKINFEIVRNAKLKLLDEIEKKNALQNGMNDPVKVIIDLLEHLKEAQQKLNISVTQLKQSPNKWRNKKKRKVIPAKPDKERQLEYADSQQSYQDSTKTILNHLWTLEVVSDSLQSVLQIPTKSDTTYQVPIEKMDSVFWQQDSLVVYIQKKLNHRDLTSYQRSCISLIQETIDYFNQQFNQDPNMPEGKESEGEEGDESEESSEESESEMSESKNMKQSQLNEMQEMDGFPPPNDNAQEILNQEKKNNESRKKKKSKYKSVEKDW